MKNNFHNWWFSEKYGFECNQYVENGSEISESRFINLLIEEYETNINSISRISSEMLVVGFAKISYVSSIDTGRSLGNILSSSNDISDDLMGKFIESHKGIFREVWINIKNHDSFRIYWDNIAMYGDIELRMFLASQSQRSLKLIELFEFFCESRPHMQILKDIGFCY